MKKWLKYLLTVLVILLGATIVAALAITHLQKQSNVQNENRSEVQSEVLEEQNDSEEDLTTEMESEIAGSLDEPEEEIVPIDSEVTMLFTGDVLLSDYVLSNYRNAGVTGVVSQSLLEEMQTADFCMINEEFPFSTNGAPVEDKQYTFQVNPQYVSVFEELGVDGVTLANNHALDYGTTALEDTFTTLDQAGIGRAGAGATIEEASSPILKELGEQKIAFLAASRVIPEVNWNIDNRAPGLFCTYDGTALCNKIKEVKQTNDLVVVYVHWGIERNTMPEDYQRSLAKSYIDAGADLVIGAHPHVLQGIEYYNGKPIVYSLGNFIFNQTIEKTAALKVRLKNGELSLQLIPAMASGACTQEISEAESAAFYDYMEEISFDIQISEDGMIENLKTE